MRGDFGFVLAVAVVAWGVLPPGEAVFQCPAANDGIPRGACSSCVQPATCINGFYLAGTECPDGRACVVNRNGGAECRPLVEVDGCRCGDIIGTACDPYDSDLQIACFPGGDGALTMEMGTDCSARGPLHTCSSGQCVEVGNPCENIMENTYINGKPDECSTGYFCVNQVTVHTEYCSNEEYFDLTSQKCQPIPVDPCAGCDATKCPILSDCTRYAECSDGKLLSIKPCAPSTYFDANTRDCTEHKTGDCVHYEGCDIPIAGPSPPPTTPEPKPAKCTAADENERFPHETNCKMYYTCRLITASTYGFVLSTCSGPYVYNPRKSQCDYASNVPSCQV